MCTWVQTGFRGVGGLGLRAYIRGVLNIRVIMFWDT